MGIFGHKSGEIAKIYTHVSKISFASIKNLLDSLMVKKLWLHTGGCMYAVFHIYYQFGGISDGHTGRLGVIGFEMLEVKRFGALMKFAI